MERWHNQAIGYGTDLSPRNAETNSVNTLYYGDSLDVLRLARALIAVPKRELDQKQAKYEPKKVAKKRKAV